MSILKIFVLLYSDRYNVFPRHIKKNKKKRYAYLVNWKRRKFHNCTQGWHSGFHAIAWAAITTFVCTGFPTTSNSERGIAVPRFRV